MVGMKDDYKPSDETKRAFERRSEACEKLAKFCSALMQKYDFDPFEMLGIIDQQMYVVRNLMGDVSMVKELMEKVVGGGTAVPVSMEELKADPDGVAEKISDTIKAKLLDILNEEDLK